MLLPLKNFESFKQVWQFFFGEKNKFSFDKIILVCDIENIRRIFEHLGYDVKNLDRVMFANLTKKNVDRGKWRMLQEKEVRLLKYMNQSFTKTKQNG